MLHILEGMAFGLALSILVGPLLFALVQTSMEKGLKAGFGVAMGIWVSDILFIAALLIGGKYLSTLINQAEVRLWISVAGVMVLLIVGFWTIYNSGKRDAPLGMDTVGTLQIHLPFIYGFLVNTINPFTVFFWFGAMIAVMQTHDTNARFHSFLMGIMGVVILGDSMKVVLAKKIANKMTRLQLKWVSRISGAALIIFGLIILLRVIISPSIPN